MLDYVAFSTRVLLKKQAQLLSYVGDVVESFGWGNETHLAVTLNAILSA